MRSSILALLIVMISVLATTAAAQRSGEDGRRKAEQLPVDKPASSPATTGQRENSHDRSNGKEEATIPKLQTQRIPYSFFNGRQDTVVTWLGMAGVLINVRGTVNAHLGPAGSAKLAKTCGAKVLVAYHYGTFVLAAGSFGGCDPKDSLPYVKELSAAFLQLNPGELLRLPLATTE